MEVAGRNDAVLLREDGRVVGNCVDFGFYHLARVAQRIARGPVHLWHAAEAVRILHVGFGAGNACAAFQQFAHTCSHMALAGMRSHSVHFIAEGLGTAVEGFQRERRKHICPIGQTPSA